MAKTEQDWEENRHKKRETQYMEREEKWIEEEKMHLCISLEIRRKRPFKMSEKIKIRVKIMTIVALIHLPTTIAAVSFTEISPKLAHILTLCGFCLDFFTSRYHKIQNG